jgi:hypothetical protein
LDFPANILYSFFFSFPCVLHVLPFPILYLIILVMLDQGYNLWRFSLCSFLQPPVTLVLFGQNILLSTIFSPQKAKRTSCNSELGRIRVLLPWRWRRNVPPKRRFFLLEPSGDISQRKTSLILSMLIPCLLQWCLERERWCPTPQNAVSLRQTHSAFQKSRAHLLQIQPSSLPYWSCLTGTELSVQRLVTGWTAEEYELESRYRHIFYLFHVEHGIY